MGNTRSCKACNYRAHQASRAANLADCTDAGVSCSAKQAAHLCLAINRGVKINVVQDDSICAGEVEALAAGARAEQHSKHPIVRIVEPAVQTLAEQTFHVTPAFYGSIDLARNAWRSLA